MGKKNPSATPMVSPAMASGSKDRKCWDLLGPFSHLQPGLELTQEGVWGGAVPGTTGSVSTSRTRTPFQKSPSTG